MRSLLRRVTAVAALSSSVAFSPKDLHRGGLFPARLAARSYRPSLLWLSTNAVERDGGEPGELDIGIDFDGDYKDTEELIPGMDIGEVDVETEGAAAPSPSLQLFEALSSSIEDALAAVEKKRKSLQNELDKAKGLETTMARANLIVSNLYRLPPGTKKATVEDWENGGVEIELVLDTDKYGSAQEESDALFAAARKMKRGSVVVEDLLEKTEGAEQILRDGQMDLAAVATRGPDGGVDEGMVVLIQERMQRSASRTGFKMPQLMDELGKKKKSQQQQQQQNGSSPKKTTRYQPSFRHLKSPGGLKVLVGRNRRDNEAICFQVARGDDVWMHARGCPGAHVLLQVRRGSTRPADADLQFAANVAAFYSDARTERKAPVTVAEPKHILKPRGAPPGAVKLRKEGPTLVGRPEDVPTELKAAREESGGAWDETGYQKLGGRAKNKKRTASVLKQSQAKKRAEKKEKRKRRHRTQEDEADWS